jgi:hypothetical protein
MTLIFLLFSWVIYDHIYMMQPPRVTEAMRRSSRRATCLGRPGRGYGTTVPPAGDSIWCDA